MGEIGVDGEGFAEALALHEDEAKAIDHAVVLVVVLRHVLEGSSLFFLGCPVYFGHLLAVEELSQGNGFAVADLPSREADRFEDDMIGCQKELR